MVPQKEIFENNRITEALCQFRFEESVDTSKFPLFFEELKKGDLFVEKQELPMLQFNFNAINSTSNQILVNGLKISNINKDKIVQLHSDNISIHQVGNYKTWEDFKDEIFIILDAFNKIFNCNIVRIDLRAINNFEFNIDEELKTYFNIFLTSPNSVLQPYNFNLAIEQTYEPTKKFGVVRLNGYNQGNKQKVVFDLSYVFICSQEVVKTAEIDTLSNALEYGHIRLSELFKESITEETRKIIK